MTMKQIDLIWIIMIVLSNGILHCLRYLYCQHLYVHVAIDPAML